MIISRQKEYYIKLFIKISKMEENIDSSIKFIININGNMCNLTEEDKIEIEKRFTKEEYIKQIIPVIDKNFSIEEIKELINFYGSNLGRKILDKKYIEDIKSISDNFSGKIQSEIINYQNNIK